MEKHTEKTQKQEYSIPRIVHVKLDNLISLQMASTPPQLGNEASLMKPEYMNNDPFKANLG
jgi:hypothetical protein